MGDVIGRICKGVDLLVYLLGRDQSGRSSLHACTPAWQTVDLCARARFCFQSRPKFKAGLLEGKETSIRYHAEIHLCVYIVLILATVPVHFMFRVSRFVVLQNSGPSYFCV